MMWISMGEAPYSAPSANAVTAFQNPALQASIWAFYTDCRLGKNELFHIVMDELWRAAGHHFWGGGANPARCKFLLQKRPCRDTINHDHSLQNIIV